MKKMQDWRTVLRSKAQDLKEQKIQEEIQRLANNHAVTGLAQLFLRHDPEGRLGTIFRNHSSPYLVRLLSGGNLIHAEYNGNRPIPEDTLVTIVEDSKSPNVPYRVVRSHPYVQLLGKRPDRPADVISKKYFVYPDNIHNVPHGPYLAIHADVNGVYINLGTNAQELAELFFQKVVGSQNKS